MCPRNHAQVCAIRIAGIIGVVRRTSNVSCCRGFHSRVIRRFRNVAASQEMDTRGYPSSANAG
jgi:hypothetical protein